MSATIFALNPKNAAIYYDKVIPVGLHHEELPVHSDVNAKEFFKKIPKKDDLINTLPDHLKGNQNFVYYISITFALYSMRKKLEAIKDSLENSGGIKSSAEIEECDQLIKSIKVEKHELQKSLISLIKGDTVFDFYFSSSDGVESFDLVLLNGSLIDCSAATWEQIMELRRDQSSRLALLNFRKFFYDKFDGWSEGQVVEELERLKSEYDISAKKHGFDLTAQSITSILSSRSVAGGGIAALIAAGAGLGPWALTAAAIPVVAEMGKFALQLGANRHSVAEFQRSNPISFLSIVEERIAG